MAVVLVLERCLLCLVLKGLVKPGIGIEGNYSLCKTVEKV